MPVRLLIDENLSERLVRALSEHYPGPATMSIVFVVGAQAFAHNPKPTSASP